MDLSCGYSINAPDVVAEDFSGQIVILNLGNGHYFSLQGIASPIWALLLAGHAPKDILDSIEKSRQDVVAESSHFIGRLLELNLIVPRAGTAGPAAPIDAGWDGASPQIDVFDDLAELIFADPIHDVDEQAGWPTPRQNP
jgi:hypothetical protein